MAGAGGEGGGGGGGVVYRSGLDRPRCGAASGHQVARALPRAPRTPRSACAPRRRSTTSTGACDDASCALRTQATRVGAPAAPRAAAASSSTSTRRRAAARHLESFFDTAARRPRRRQRPRPAARVAAALPAEHRAIHELLRAQVSATLARSGYNWVSSSVFATSAAVKESTELRDAGEKKPDAAEAATAMDTEAEGVEYALWDAPAAAHHTAALRALAAGV